MLRGFEEIGPRCTISIEEMPLSEGAGSEMDDMGGPSLPNPGAKLPQLRLKAPDRGV